LSTVPFRHGPTDVVEAFSDPDLDNPAAPLQRRNPNGLQDELIRHLNEDRVIERLRLWDPASSTSGG